MKYFEITQSSSEITTLGEFSVKSPSPISTYKDKLQEFLDLKDLDQVSNKERIFSLYNTREDKENSEKQPKDLLIKFGTSLIIPVTDIESPAMLTQGIEVVSNDIPAFKAQKIRELEADPAYLKSSKKLFSHPEFGTIEHSSPSVTVWCWCKSLSNTTDAKSNENILDSMEGQIIDLTPFVQKVKTSVTKNGGNFSIELPPLTGSLVEEEIDGKRQSKWVLDRDHVLSYKYGAKINGYVDEVISYSSLFTRTLEGSLELSTFFFSNIIRENDVIFIRFETLELEAEQRYFDAQSFIIDKSNISGRIYDMIGLVDTNAQGLQTESTNVSISIAGRDLIKLFLDDGTYFYNLENVTGQYRIAGKATQKNELMGRLLDGSLYFLSLYQNNSVEDVMKFVIQQLSTISVVPDSLFFSYGEERNTRFETDGSTRKNIQGKKEAEERKLSLQRRIKYFKQLYDFVREIKTKNVHQLNGKKIVGWFPFTQNDGGKLGSNELPPFLKRENDLYRTSSKPFNPTVDTVLYEEINQINEVIELEDSKPLTDNENTEILAAGIWQIVKLVIDKNVSKRRIVDSSMSSANGPLINFLRKVCQEPFVEFYSDTYGDMFHLIARKPPYDKRSIVDEIQEFIVDIESHNISSHQLQNDTTAYSWYTFKPQNIFTGGGSVLPTAYVPALFFEEYANIWGSRPYEMIHNYNPYYSYVTEDGIPDVSRFEMQAFEDLKYLVEIHAHLPFTRRGSIILSHTDRRIKKGSFIRNIATREIFYVDAVSHNYSISESDITTTTALEVSRGMVEDFIYGKKVGDLENVSYFNIINTNINVNLKKFEDNVTVVTKTRQVKKITKVPVEETEDILDSIVINNKKLTNKQKQNAQQIYEVGTLLGAQKRDIQIAIMVSIAAAGLTNVVSGTDAVGLFTLKVSEKWGERYELIDTRTSITRFFIGYNLNSKKGLLNYSNRNSGTATQAAFKVQAFDTPIANVARYEGVSKQIVDYYTAVYSGGATTFTKKQFIEKEQITTEKYEEEVRTPGYVGVDREAVFADMKVNREIFNFFLRGEQFKETEIQKFA